MGPQASRLALPGLQAWVMSARVKVVDDLREGAQPDVGGAVQPHRASRGQTSPMARVVMERSTPNQQASMSWGVPCRRCTSVASSRSIKPPSATADHARAR